MLVVACSSGSGSSSAGDGSGGNTTCPPLPHNKTDFTLTEGMVFCDHPATAGDGVMLMCRDGAWQTVLDCSDSTASGNACHCYDDSHGTEASCGYEHPSDCGVSVPFGGGSASASGSGTGSGSGSANGSGSSGGAAPDGG